MRLLLDAMCGGVRSYLRMCGHDTAYVLDRGVEADERILALARDEDRTLVTRDRALGRRAAAVILDARSVEGQLRELRAAGVSLSLADPPTRCGRCNGTLRRTEAADHPEYVPDDAAPVWQCVDCDQRFWKGSHWADVRDRLAGLAESEESGKDADG